MIAGAAWLLSARDFVKIGGDVGWIDDAVMHGNDQVASLGESAFIGINYDASAAHSFIINFTGVRLKCSDQVQVRARAKPKTIKERLGCGGAGTNHIRFAGADFRGDRLDFDSLLCFHLPAKSN